MDCEIIEPGAKEDNDEFRDNILNDINSFVGFSSNEISNSTKKTF